MILMTDAVTLRSGSELAIESNLVEGTHRGEGGAFDTEENKELFRVAYEHIVTRNGAPNKRLVIRSKRIDLQVLDPRFFPEVSHDAIGSKRPRANRQGYLVVPRG